MKFTTICTATNATIKTDTFNNSYAYLYQICDSIINDSLQKK
jgi:hypothetical protein